jgi:SAM-dependent methyltransferase
VAIGSLHVEWLSAMARRGAWPRNASVLELGPQDIWVERGYMAAVARRHQPADKAAALIDRMYDGETARPDAQPPFYEIFGAASYCAVDAFDARAKYKADLNEPVPQIGRFDVITNFGTVEHVFNVITAFASIHRLLRVGGVSLHAMPVLAYLNHGFYNINPCFFTDLSRTNKYDLVDLFYVDNFYVRQRRQDREKDTPFDFSTLPITSEDMRDTRIVQSFMAKAVARFAANVAETPAAEINGDPSVIFDMCLAGMRLTGESPKTLATPTQFHFSGTTTPDVAPKHRSGIRRWMKTFSRG